MFDECSTTKVEVEKEVEKEIESSSKYLNTIDYKYLCDTIGKNDTDYYLERVKAFLKKHPNAEFDIRATILKWHREDTKADAPKEVPKTYTSEQLNALFDLSEDEL